MGQDCFICFYKFAGQAKSVNGWCAMHDKCVKQCTEYKNNVVIDGEQYHFINPLTEPCLDKGR